MKKIISALLVLASQTLLAISIHNIEITPLSGNTINVSLTTEAAELYYFHSWNYSVNANVITVNAFFIEGFGSTIAYLNNNFAVPLTIPQQYTLILRIFYTDTSHTFKTLKDMVRMPYRHRKRAEVMRG